MPATPPTRGRKRSGATAAPTPRVTATGKRTASPRISEASCPALGCPGGRRSALLLRPVLGPFGVLLGLGVRVGEVLRVFLADHDLDGDALLLELLDVLGIVH